MGKPKKSVHFLGVAGIGVSGLALWYKNLGWVVTGSDIAVSPVTEMLNRFGIKPEITADQFKRIPKDADLIIHTQAIDRSKITTTPGVVVSEERFFEFLHVGFCHKRKMLLKNLKNSTIKPRRFHSWAEAVNACGINEKARAENLSLDDWKCLIKSRARQ